MKNRIKVLPLLMTLAVLGSGCGSRSVDYDVENTEQTGDVTEVENAGLTQDMEDIRWESTWEGQDAAGNPVSFRVNAQITVPDVDSMSVVEVKAPEEGEAYCQEVVEAAFPQEEIYYYDDARLPKALLQEKVESYEQELEELQEMIAEQDDLAWDTNTDDLDDTIRETKEKLLNCKTALEQASDDFIPVSSYDGENYRGMRNGVPYLLDVRWSEEDLATSFYYPLEDGTLAYIGQVTTGEATRNEQKQLDISLKPEDIHEVCPEEVQQAKDLEVTAIGSIGEVENESALSMKEAGDLARQTLRELGFSDVVQVAAYNLLWVGDPEETGEGEYRYSASCTDGYLLRYMFGFDGLSATGYGVEGQYSDYDKGQDFYSMMSYAEVYVTEQGVIALELHNPLETITMTEHIKLLPLENIRKIMEDALTDQPEMFPFLDEEIVKFDSMELIYFRVSDEQKKGFYSFVPAWRLSYHNSGAWAYENAVMVNAIDGSIIDLQQQFASQP